MSKLYQILIVSLLFICNWASTANSQTRLRHMNDSLTAVLHTQIHDSDKVKTMGTLIWAKFNLAQSHTGNFNDVIEWSNKMLQLSKATNNKWGEGRANFVLGLSLKQIGKLPEALKHYMRAHKISLEMANHVLTVNTGNYIGNIYRAMGNYDEALKYYFSTLNVVLKNNISEWIQKTHNYIGHTYLEQGRYQMALNHYLEAEKHIKGGFDDPETIYQSLAKVYEKLNNEQLAQQYYKKALEKTGSMGAVNRQLLYSDAADLYLKKSRANRDSSSYFHEVALDLLQKARTDAEGVNQNLGLINIYEMLADVYHLKGDYQNAFKYKSLYVKYKDSIYSRDSYLKVADVRMQYEREKAAAEEKARLYKLQLNTEAENQQMLADEKLKRELAIAEHMIAHEKAITEQKLKEEIAVAEEKARHQQTIAATKARQEKLNADQEQKNLMLITGAGGIFITSVFLVLFLRQQQLKKRAIEKAEALHKMAELELQSLRSQLNPHFMFNSLNSIQELILMEENDKSHLYLARFSKLLRMLLENAEKPFITLQKELDFLQLYLGLENLRVPDLQYSISTQLGVNAEEVLIPNMILQPYIENAIWHGLSYKDSNKQLQIRIYRENGSINYEIEDNGVGRKKAAELKSVFRQTHNSKGMELLNKRFKLLNEEYSSHIDTTINDVIVNNEVQGTLVTIKVPLQISLN